MKKVAIVGAHGVGKTILSRQVASCERVNYCNRIELIEEVVRDCPFPINNKSSIDGGFWIVCEQIAREQKAKSRNPDVIICDRSSIDPVMYMKASDFPAHEYAYLFSFARKWMQTYDKIVYIKANPNLEIVDDGFRATDREFQLKVDKEFFQFLTTMHHDFMSDIMVIDSLDLVHKNPTINLEKIVRYIYEEE